jgi:hypothetical protein
MSNHDDFWTTIATGHTNTVLAGGMDSHLAPTNPALAVRHLTDRHRNANALVLPVKSGTRVSFTGGLGAHLTYDNVPAGGSLGEVTTVKSAHGNITEHDGKVFVQWDDGQFRAIHAQHLRRAGKGKSASDLKADFEKIKALAEKKPDNEFLMSLLEQMADEGFAPTDKQMAVVKKIEGEAKEMATMQKELKSLEKKASFRVGSLGDLTDFLKHADGRLIHKSTDDLWSYAKDADGNFLVSRLFNDAGEPLKG